MTPPGSSPLAGPIVEGGDIGGQPCQRRCPRLRSVAATKALRLMTSQIVREQRLTDTVRGGV